MLQLQLRVPILCVFVLLLLSPVQGEAFEHRKPNFIFVLSDDIAQGDLGCYGQKLIQTPRLDRMAAEGTRYLQAYCGTSVCAPSRSSFFTGLHCRPLPGARQLRSSTGRPTAPAGRNRDDRRGRQVSRLRDRNIRQMGHGLFRFNRQSLETGCGPLLRLQLPAPCSFVLSDLPVLTMLSRLCCRATTARRSARPTPRS